MKTSPYIFVKSAMEKYKSNYRIPSTRLANWDYGAHGLNFVTICTKDKQNYFGEIVSGMQNETLSIASLRSTVIGETAFKFWEQIPVYHHPFVELDEFIVMPNHVHGIIFINKPDNEQWQKNKFGPQSGNLASVIRGYKAAVKKYATINQIDFAWQSRYFDRVIRSDKELQNIRSYIFNNPANWEAEKNNPENLFM
jgi:putative transposase